MEGDYSQHTALLVHYQHFQLWPLSSVEQHVERSRGHLLDIVIRSCEKENFVKRLDVVIPHIQRWRTLIVSCQDDDKVLSLLLRKLGNSTLPHLVHVEVWESENAPMRFLRPKNTPALERLQLDGLPRDCFPSHGKRRAQARPTLPSQLLSQRLTALSLLIDTPNISLQPNSIILPLLTSLSLRVATPRKLMEAIVAPKLVSFCIKRNVSNIKLSTVFNDLGDKYNGVQNLALCGPFHEQKLEDAKAVCLTFPKVQNVEIAIEEIPIFCGKDQNNMFPADHWDQLQCLVVNFYGYYEVPYGGELESWLQRRSDQNRSKLRVMLMDFPEGHNMEFEDTIHSMLPYLLDAVKELCKLEFINAPLGHGVGLTVHKNFPLQVVGAIVV